MLVAAIVLTLLVLVNSLYVASEFAAVAVQRAEIAPLARAGNRRAVGLEALHEDGTELDRYIAACQIGITLSSLVVGAYGQATLGPPLEGWLASAVGMSEAASGTTAFVVVLVGLTTLQVVFGELVPKSLALQFPLRTALLTYLPTKWSVTLYRGFIWLLNGSALLLLKPFGVVPGGHQHVHSPEELEILLGESKRSGALSTRAHRRLERGLHLSERTVRQMMTPRSDVYAIDASMPPEAALARILESPYSRIPVYEGTLDRIVGSVDTKDVASWFTTEGEIPPLARVLRPIPFVPETMRAHRFVRFLQEQRSSKAIVVDEFGGVEGIVSIDDVLGKLFGGVGDELKSPARRAKKRPDGSVLLPGATPIDEAAALLDVQLETQATTIGGLIVEHLGRLPTAGEAVEIEGVEITVTEMGPTAVQMVAARPPTDGDRSGE